MFPVQIQLKTMEGQKVMINLDSGVIILEIEEPFMKAGKILNWDLSVFGSPGFGINKTILRFVIENKLKMLVRHDTGTQKEFWSNYDVISQFIKNNNTEYKCKSKFLHVLPWKLFHSKPSFSGSNSVEEKP